MVGGHPHNVGSKLERRFEEALALHQAGDFSEAQKRYRQILRKQPSHAHALHLLGVIDLQRKHFADALALIERAIALNPRNPGFYSNRANALQQLNRLEDAVDSYDQALALKPDYLEALHNRSSALQKLGRYEQALAGYQQAKALAPRDAEVHVGCALTLQALGRYPQALASLEEALAHNPRSASAWCNRGNVLRESGDVGGAAASYERALTLQPTLAVAYCNRGHLYQEAGDFTLAIIDYEQAITHGRCSEPPQYEYLRGAILHAKLSLCDWQGIGEQIDLLVDDALRGQLCSVPFPLLTLSDSGAAQRAVAEAWCASCIPVRPVPVFPTNPAGKERICLGYFSADFHQHATSQLIAELFECHDRERFELIAFSYGPPLQDAMRGRLERAFDHFLDVRKLGDAQVAARARELGLDIAIDLKGYTRGQRPGIFAWRAAPVQVSYLGYPGTLGNPTIDYLIADPVLVTPATRQHYVEQVVYLPGSYQVNDSQRPIAGDTPPRRSQGLPDDAMVFASFNALFKLTPAVFDSWMTILQAVPDSVLWLLEGSPEATANLRREAAARGLAGERLVFAPRLPLAEHLARHACADLFLDTFPCNAHTTASDALWAGLPLLTLSGESFASRVAASLLHAVGLPELVTQTLDDYTALAIELATDPARLEGLRSTLAAARSTSSLFDAAGFAAQLERAFTIMVERQRQGQAPQDICLEP